MFDDHSEGHPLRRAWDWFLHVGRGVRTLIVAALMGAAGFADQFDYVDVMAFVRAHFGESARLGTVLIVVSVVFIVLRLFTNGPAKLKRFGKADEVE